MDHAGVREFDAARSDGLRPGGRVAGPVRVPGSKSLAQRWLLAACVAAGRTRVGGLPEGDDVQAALELVRGLGVEVHRPYPGALTVVGRPPGPGRGPGLGARGRGPGTEWLEVAVELGESGTLARLATALLGLCGWTGARYRLVPRGSLARRTSTPLLRALVAAGVDLEPLGGGEGSWPLRISPLGPPPTLRLVRPGSSQEVSALLLALAAWPDELLLEVEGEVPSRPYVDLTLAVLRTFGARVQEVPGGFLVQGPLSAPQVPLLVEPDASAAAVALAAGCLSGGEVRVEGIGAGSCQGDVRVVEHLRALGCEAGAEVDGLWARGAPEGGVRLDLVGEPDLAPVLAVCAAAAALRLGSRTVLEGLGTLPGKESSRIAVLAAGLRAVGCAVDEGPRHLEIGPGPGACSPEAPLDPHGDHRMAFAFALLGLVVDGVRVRSPQCVGKSWPGFWRDLERAGARRAGPSSPDSATPPEDPDA